MVLQLGAFRSEGCQWDCGLVCVNDLLGKRLLYNQNLKRSLRDRHAIFSRRRLLFTELGVELS